MKQLFQTRMASQDGSITEKQLEAAPQSHKSNVRILRRTTARRAKRHFRTLNGSLLKQQEEEESPPNERQLQKVYASIAPEGDKKSLQGLEPTLEVSSIRASGVDPVSGLNLRLQEGLGSQFLSTVTPPNIVYGGGRNGASFKSGPEDRKRQS